MDVPDRSKKKKKLRKSSLLYGCTTLNHGSNAHNIAVVRPPISYLINHPNHPSKTNIRSTTGEDLQTLTLSRYWMQSRRPTRREWIIETDDGMLSAELDDNNDLRIDLFRY